MVAPHEPVAQLLASVAARDGVPAMWLRLLWRSRRVRLDRSLAWHGIAAGSTVFVTSVLFGGVGFTDADVARVCQTVQLLAAADGAARAHMEAGRWDGVLPRLAARSGVAAELVSAIVAERGRAMAQAVAVGSMTALMMAARKSKGGAAAAGSGTAAAAAVTAAQQEQAQEQVGATISPASQPGVRRVPPTAPRPVTSRSSTAAQHGGSGSSSTMDRQLRAQLAALRRITEESSAQAASKGTAPATAGTCTFRAPGGEPSGAPAAEEDEAPGCSAGEVLGAVVAVLEADAELRRMADRLELGMAQRGEPAKLATQLQQQLPPRLRCGCEESMRKWLFAHRDDISLALAGERSAAAPAVAGEVAAAADAAGVSAVPDAPVWQVRTGLDAVARMVGVAEREEEQEGMDAWQERCWRSLGAQIEAERSGGPVPMHGTAPASEGTGATNAGNDDVRAAQRMRDELEAQLPRHVCCVCSRRRKQREVQWVRLSSVKEWADAHLAADLPCTAKVPRDGNTLWAPPTDVEAAALLAQGGASAAQLAAQAVCTRTKGEAEALLQMMRAEQEGYARARYGTAEEQAAREVEMARQAEPPAVAAPDPRTSQHRGHSRGTVEAEVHALIAGLPVGEAAAAADYLQQHNFAAAAGMLMRAQPSTSQAAQHAPGLRKQLRRGHRDYETVSDGGTAGLM
ncbi:hypothetical protein HXX76_005684 [Chlamydomonas incerta]|uniref:Ubiquitin-like domain-containing protein n=1 Tax=Chlamydomonas incerta TaxID=51695 RepID=A0A835TG38_CHLIN|nr:hypothetical protein HXX76_005684 [Chlamydomonas incerta]|eukprot:KAG2438075.1 hypothetical protein HXX76_005684 [Chlamydomonas incerta]